MANIELVIKIPEEVRLALVNNVQLSSGQQSICDSYLKHAIINGTPLSKSNWIWDGNKYKCSKCGHHPWRINTEEHDEAFEDLWRTNAYKFCPNCGAKMIENEEEFDNLEEMLEKLWNAGIEVGK